MSLEKDKTQSSWAFTNLGWPAIHPMIGGELIDIENNSADLAGELDMSAGVDYWIKKPNGDLIGVAARMQTMSFATFTIRYRRMGGKPTEWEKRKRWVESGQQGLGPHLTIQGYWCTDANEARLVRIAAIETKRLIEIMSPYEKHAVAVEEWRDKPFKERREMRDAGFDSEDKRCFMQRAGGYGNWFFVCPWLWYYKDLVAYWPSDMFARQTNEQLINRMVRDPDTKSFVKVSEI